MNEQTKQLTREQILSMPAGIELDQLVGKHIFGYDLYTEFSDRSYKDPNCVLPSGWKHLPNYSTDISATWGVEEKIIELGKEDDYGFELYLITGAEEKSVNQISINVFKIVHATPEHRCKASLLAVMGL